MALNTDSLNPLDDENAQLLWECIGISYEELEDMKEDYDASEAARKEAASLEALRRASRM